jgi:hypothetical protein
LQRDPIGIAGSHPNLYLYCGNHPIVRKDPSGLDWFDELTNYVAGWGDALSFGLTNRVREWAGVNDAVDMSSSAYAAGSLTGSVHGLAMGAPGLIHTAARVGRGVKGAYQAWQAGRGALNVGGQECSKLYVYTSEKTAELIEDVGHFGRKSNPTVYLTPNGNLTPLQAQLELALPQHNTATVVFEIPASALKKEMVELIRRVTGNIDNRPGGGWEVIYRGFIPFDKARRVR